MWLNPSSDESNQRGGDGNRTHCNFLAKEIRYLSSLPQAVDERRITAPLDLVKLSYHTQEWLVKNLTNALFGAAPTYRSTSLPAFIKTSVGMPVTLKSAARLGSLSTLTFTIFTPSTSSFTSFRIGFIALQGAHHSAQKSIRTGVTLSITSST